MFLLAFYYPFLPYILFLIIFSDYKIPYNYIKKTHEQSLQYVNLNPLILSHLYLPFRNHSPSTTPIFYHQNQLYYIRFVEVIELAQYFVGITGNTLKKIE